MDTRKIGEAVEAYRLLVKLDYDAKLAEARVNGKLHGFTSEEFDLYVQLTQQIDAAADAVMLTNRTLESRGSTITARHVFNRAVNAAGLFES